MLVPLLLVGTLLAQPAAVPARKETGFDALAVPLLSFNSDTGFGYGGVFGAYFYSPGYAPYRYAIAAQFYATTRNISNHFLRFDGPKFFGNVRLEARLEYRRESLSPYYGAGNDASPEFTGNVDDKNYNYKKFSPGGWIRFRGSPFGVGHAFQTYASVGWRNTSVDAYDDSVLAKDRPIGFEGGQTGQISTGALWDTRNEEADPSSGGLSEFGFRVSSKSTLSRYTYAGFTLADRHYWRINPRFVFAERVMLDYLIGDVPFFEWPFTGGILQAEGLGGLSSIRGIERNRFVGNVKLFSNSELRAHLFDFKILKWGFKLGAVGLVDVGRAWQPGVDNGPWYKMHAGFGTGLRLSRRAAVIRFDYAVTPETWRQGIYFTFGHMF